MRRLLASVFRGPDGREIKRSILDTYTGNAILEVNQPYPDTMRTIACRRRAVTTATPPFDEVTTDFSATVRGADFVSLHLNAEPANHHFLDRTRLAMIPSHAWLINTARGSVVDELALYDALVGERLAGAALDVFDREPYVPADPSRDLRTLPNVVLAPHVGSHTREANRGMAERALQNVMPWRPFWLKTVWEFD